MQHVERISGLTLEEWVALKATLHSITEERFSCGACLHQFGARPDAAVMLEKTRAQKGCYGGDGQLRHTLPHGDGRVLRFSTCVGNWVRPQLLNWLEVHNAYENGVLPFPGSLHDQPAKAMEILGVVGQWKVERRREEAEKLAKSATPKGGRRRGR